MAVGVLWPFLTVPWVGLQCVIVVFPDHTHLLFYKQTSRLSHIIRAISHHSFIMIEDLFKLIMKRGFPPILLNL